MKKYFVLFSVIGLMTVVLTGCTKESDLGRSNYNVVVNADQGIANNGREVLNSSATQLQLGKASVGGCLVLGDSANGASPVYITATGTTVTATTTKPSACSTAK